MQGSDNTESLILEKFSTLNLNVASLRASSSSSTSQTWSVFAMVFTPISTWSAMTSLSAIILPGSSWTALGYNLPPCSSSPVTGTNHPLNEELLSKQDTQFRTWMRTWSNSGKMLLATLDTTDMMVWGPSLKFLAFYFRVLDEFNYGWNLNRRHEEKIVLICFWLIPWPPINLMNVDTGQRKQEKKKEKIPKIVATFVYASSQGQCTRSIGPILAPEQGMCAKVTSLISGSC